MSLVDLVAGIAQVIGCDIDVAEAHFLKGLGGAPRGADIVELCAVAKRFDQRDVVIEIRHGVDVGNWGQPKNR